MEDAHTHILDYEHTGAGFFAVFDGHGGKFVVCGAVSCGIPMRFYYYHPGANVAKYSSQNLSRIVIESDEFKKGEYKDALRKGFLKIDENLRAGRRHANSQQTGC